MRLTSQDAKRLRAREGTGRVFIPSPRAGIAGGSVPKGFLNQGPLWVPEMPPRCAAPRTLASLPRQQFHLASAGTRSHLQTALISSSLGEEVI